ncbi:MAG TPA: hypothetical protein ENJ78_00570 [candidate division WWE3 bacterium]|uniref:DksA C4-type domain-containing protein n=1 Tax=candidate division WWE3 bacterium TaxID=2053526 RepID=A0A7V5J197_UNCKA|nr:hypothetical protein [candidate division WWE3 bacterium]
MSLSSEFLGKQKEILLKKRKRIQDEINRLRKEDPFVQEYEEDGFRNIDEEDAQEQAGHDDVVAAIATLEEDLKQVEKALKRIEEGTYGYDENTGEPIPIDRLEAYPEATTNV